MKTIIATLLTVVALSSCMTEKQYKSQYHLKRDKHTNWELYK